DTLKFFWEIYGPLFILLIVVGAVSGFRFPEVRYLCLGSPLLFIIFYSFWVHLMPRYMMIAQPFLILLAVAGYGRFLEKTVPTPISLGWLVILGADLWVRAQSRRPYGLQTNDLLVAAFGFALWFLMGKAGSRMTPSSRIRIFSLVLLACVLIDKGPRLLQRRDLFQLDDAVRFGRDFDRIIPAGSVVFSTKPVTQLISLSTSSYSIRPIEIERTGESLREAVNTALRRGVNLYLIDNLGGPKEKAAADYIPVLLDDFDLTPMGSLKGNDYNLTFHFGQEVCTLYRIEPWSQTTVEIPVHVASLADDCLLTLIARKIWATDRNRQRVDFEFNGHPLAVRIENGANFIHLPKEMLSAPLSRLVLHSDRPLPRSPEAALQSIWADYVVNLGPWAKTPDRSFSGGLFSLGILDLHQRRLSPDQPGFVLIPALPIPDTELIGEVSIKNAQNCTIPLTLSITDDGRDIFFFDLSSLSGWRRLLFRLSPAGQADVRRMLELLASFPGTAKLSLPDARMGALILSEVRVKRWLQQAFLETPAKDFYYLSFILRSLPATPPFSSVPTTAGPCRVFLNGSLLATALPGETVRLILAPGDIARTSNLLEALPDDPGSRVLIERRPYLQRPSSHFLIDVGEQDDWAFIGEGFNDPALRSGKTTARWTDETATVFLPLFPSQGTEAVITLRVIPIRPAISVRKGASVRLFWDGREMGAVPFNPESSAFSWTLPLDFPSPRVSRLFFVFPAERAADFLKTSDYRPGGILADRIEIDYRGTDRSRK
ncbi:MAG: hypothetical protein NTV79_02580, partial [Candidatus Aureabacteria bacterium]|nr:hypothetical protein [Candidatus Auribacterota bacterium]